MPGWKGTRARESSDETSTFYKPNGTDTHLNAVRTPEQAWFLQKIRTYTYISEGPRQDYKSLAQCLRKESSFKNTNKTLLGLSSFDLCYAVRFLWKSSGIFGF